MLNSTSFLSHLFLTTFPLFFVTSFTSIYIYLSLFSSSESSTPHFSPSSSFKHLSHLLIFTVFLVQFILLLTCPFLLHTLSIVLYSSSHPSHSLHTLPILFCFSSCHQFALFNTASPSLLSTFFSSHPFYPLQFPLFH